MTTPQIADRLVELCSKGDFETAQKELFSNDAVSIEQQATEAFEKETKGLQNIIKKGHKFNEMVEDVHQCKVSGQLIAGNSIAITLEMDITMKGNQRSDMNELCVYEVKDGKIISEQFFM